MGQVSFWCVTAASAPTMRTAAGRVGLCMPQLYIATYCYAIEQSVLIRCQARVTYCCLARLAEVLQQRMLLALPRNPSKVSGCLKHVTGPCAKKRMDMGCRDEEHPLADMPLCSAEQGAQDQHEAGQGRHLVPQQQLQGVPGGAAAAGSHVCCSDGGCSSLTTCVIHTHAAWH
jgi:hypothetical protein